MPASAFLCHGGARPCYAAPSVLPVVVVVDVVPADAPGEQAQALVDACSSAVSRGACGLSGATPESARPAAVAMVLWQTPGYFEATVRVGRRDGEWTSRKLTFSETDPTRERWVTAGLTIATLLDETRAEPSAATPTDAPNPAPTLPVTPAQPTPSKPPETTPPPPPKQPPGPGPARLRSRDLGLGAGLLIGNGWDESGPMTGGWVTLMLNTFQERFVALATGSFAASNGPKLPSGVNLDSRWLGAELGWGVQGGVAPFRFVAVPEVAFQSVSILLPNGETRKPKETQLKLRLAAIWEASRQWGLSVGGAVRLLPIYGPASDPGLKRRSGFAGELHVGVEFWP